VSFSVGLYRDFARQGRIMFRIVPAIHPSDYVSKPHGILSRDEAEYVSRQLGRSPVISRGVVGKYVWRQEEV